MEPTELEREVMGRWPHGVEVRRQDERGLVDLHCAPNHVPEICNWLGDTCDYSFAGLMVEQGPEAWSLRYLFYGAEDRSGWAHVATHAPLAQTSFPSISHHVHAADWHEREAEDMYGLVFTGHPRLGDFVLHDDAWQEGVAPMRKEFDRGTAFAQRLPDAKWRPTRLVHAPGAFAMPIGPVYASVTESAHFLLETVGEDVIRAFPRLFYGYRAVEKIAEGRTVDDALLLAERFSATTAFAHGLAYVQAAETITGIHVPARARVLRVLLAELERLRHHAGAIQEICESTALAVAASQASILEEDLLRLSGELTGHRYLFGLLAAGGLTRDFGDDAWRAALDRARAIVNELNMLALLLRNTSSFLDRLEEVGIVSHQEARTFGLVGPVARASGVARDLRRAQPYSDYERYAFDVACEQEGDGYARLRVLFTEARQSLQIMEQAAVGLSDGPVRVEAKALSGGAALGWVEAPRGAAFHWLHVGEDGKVLRYHIVSPSFINWHSFRLAAERFAFQDFPIILASFGLSAVENDR